jgi:hypothetical protein
LRELAEVQRVFDQWRIVYNFDRPHEALGQAVPASRYRPSPRAWPDRLPEIEYDADETVRTVGTSKDYVSFKGKLWNVPPRFPRRTCCHQASANRRTIRHLLRLVSNRNNQLDPIQQCQPCLRTRVYYVPGLNNKRGHDEWAFLALA